MVSFPCLGQKLAADGAVVVSIPKPHHRLLSDSSPQHPALHIKRTVLLNATTADNQSSPEIDTTECLRDPRTTFNIELTWVYTKRGWKLLGLVSDSTLQLMRCVLPATLATGGVLEDREFHARPHRCPGFSDSKFRTAVPFVRLFGPANEQRWCPCAGHVDE